MYQCEDTKMTTPNRRTKPDQKNDSDQFSINSGNFNRALTQYNSMLGSWIEVSKEASRFMNSRLMEDLKAADEIIETGNAIDAAQVQARFVNKMFTDYSNETQKFLRLMSKKAPNGASTKSKKKQAGVTGRSTGRSTGQSANKHQ